MARVSRSVRAAILGARAESRREQELRQTARGLRLAWAQGITVLYKLRSLGPQSRDHTFDIIENSGVYFPSPEKFNDPFDCAPPFKLAGDITDPEFVKELQRDEERMATNAGLTPAQVAEMRTKEGVPVEQMAEAVRTNTVRAIREDTRVLCLANEQSHPLMWSHYASSHTGICLHFRCSPDNLFGLARQVLYVNERRPVLIPLDRQSEDEVTERLVFEKAKFWDYESEYRVVGHKTADWGYSFDAEDRISFAAELLCGITLGLKVSEADRAALLSLAANHKPPIPVWQASESPHRFWIDLQRIR